MRGFLGVSMNPDAIGTFVAVFVKGQTRHYVELSDEERDTLLSAYPDMAEGDEMPFELFAEIHPEIAARL